MFFCPNCCASKAIEAVTTEKLVEETVHKYTNVVLSRIIALEQKWGSKANNSDVASFHIKTKEIESKFHVMENKFKTLIFWNYS